MFKLQYDYNGKFRIVHIESKRMSPWTEYTSLATLHVDGRVFCAASEYGFLDDAHNHLKQRPYTVYELTGFDTELDDSEEWNEHRRNPCLDEPRGSGEVEPEYETISHKDPSPLSLRSYCRHPSIPRMSRMK